MNEDALLRAYGLDPTLLSPTATVARASVPAAGTDRPVGAVGQPLPPAPEGASSPAARRGRTRLLGLTRHPLVSTVVDDGH